MDSFTLYYFGNIAFWIELCKHKSIVFEEGCPIQKRTYANRMIILTANGLQTLSIPIHGGRGSKTLYSDLKISDDSWKRKHLMALKTAYSKSPYYEHYIDSISNTILQKEDKLLQLNINLFEKIKKMLQLELDYTVTNSSQPANNAFDPKIQDKLEAYPQVFRDRFEFQSDLSILDLLFNLGPRSKMYLLTNAK